MEFIKEYIQSNKQKIPAFLLNIATAILGIICICFCGSLSTMFVYIVSGLILISTIAYLTYSIIKWKNIPFPMVDIVFSSLIIILCVWAMFNPTSVLNLFISAIGVLTVVSSLKWFVSSYYEYQSKISWWYDALIGSVELIVGLIILFNPFSTLKIAFIALGIYLILVSLFNIYINYKNSMKRN